MILAGGLVRVIILERPETCSFVQFSIKAFGLCPWTCHFSNPEILPVILRLGGSECCVRSGSPWKEHCFVPRTFLWPFWRAVTQSWWDVSLCDTSKPNRLFVLAELLAGQSRWKCQLLAGTVTHRWPWWCPWRPREHPGAEPGLGSLAGLCLPWSRSSYSRAKSLALVWFSLPCCSFRQVLLIQRHLVWEEPVQPCSLWCNRRCWIWCDSGKWPKPDLPAWDSGCRLVLTHHERVSFWHLCLKREEERGKFSFTVYTILITKCFCTLHLFYSVTYTPSHQKLALET